MTVVSPSIHVSRQTGVVHGVLLKTFDGRGPRMSARLRRRYPQVACTGALIGCLAGASLHCRAEEAAVTLEGLMASNTITRNASSSYTGMGAGSARPSMLPSAVEASRTRLNSDSQGAVSVDGVAYKMSYGTAVNSLSVGVGTTSYRVQPGASVISGGTSAQPAGAHTLAATMPSVSVAYNYSFRDKYQLNVEATRASSLSSQLQESLVSTKVGVAYTPARNSTVGLEQGSLSLKMSSSGNYSMKIKRGGPMFFMRRKF